MAHAKSRQHPHKTRHPMPDKNPFQAWVGTVQELNIIRFNDDGDGVARLEDITVFVPGALPGESVRARVVAAHKRHLVGEVVEWVAKQAVLMEGQASENQASGNLVSSVRVTPRCPVFDRCGGCQLQHMSYTTALEHKRQVVVNALLRIGHLDKFDVLPTIGMDEPWRYRNQIQVPLHYDAKTGQLVPGFFASGSHLIIETTSCALVPRAVEETMVAIPREISRVLEKESSVVHHLIIRHSMHTNEQMVILGVRKRPASVKELIRSLFHPPIVSLAMTVQENPTGPVWGDSVEILAGKSNLNEQLDEIEFLISPRSFFQVNTRQAEVLTELTRQRCAFQGDETVLDAYCGTGTFSLTMAHHAKEIVGIEAVAPAVKDARENAKQNGIQNARFEVGVVEHVLPRWVEQGVRFDVAVVDPPRKGCHPAVLQALVQANIPRVVYVSCNPATLARDVRILVDAGYQPEAFQPVDMFPQTNHVECCVSLVRSS